jgi:hypothetical protein
VQAARKNVIPVDFAARPIAATHRARAIVNVFAREGWGNVLDRLAGAVRRCQPHFWGLTAPRGMFSFEVDDGT